MNLLWIDNANRWWKMFSMQAFAFIGAVNALYGTLVVTKPELVSAPIPLLGWSIASLVIGLTILGALLGFIGRLLKQFDPTPDVEPELADTMPPLPAMIDPDWTPADLEGAKSHKYGEILTTMGLPAAPQAATMPAAFDNDVPPVVYARPECVFNYCATPEHCRTNGCPNSIALRS